MFQTNFVNSLLRGLDPIHQKTITLKPGQIFNGKVIKLYPGQLASMQLGGLTLTAKLEAALTAGNRYWFQVQPGEGLPVLKVLEELDQARNQRNKDGEPILRQLGIGSTKVNEMIIKFLASQELLFTKEHVMKGSETLQNVGQTNEQGLSILKHLIDKNIPITPATFKAMQSVINGEGLATKLQELSSALQMHQGKEPILQQLQQFLQTLLQQSSIKVDQHEIVELLKNFLNEKSSTQISAGQSLQNLGVIDKQTTPKSLINIMKEMMTKAPLDQLKQVWPTLTKEEIISNLTKNELPNLLDKAIIDKGQKGENTIQQLLSLLSSPKKEITLTQEKQQQPVANQLLSIIQKLGYQHERDLMQFFQQKGEWSENNLNQLKSLLLKSQQLQLPPSIHEQMDQITNRLTGQQLLSVQQQEGPIANYAVLLPLRFFGQSTDLTIQWEGKKEANGKLNPDHCRILFYLHLQNLKETVVDVQIQNRIVSLHVFNEKEKPTKLISLLQPYLKNALFELNYHLTSVKWTQPSETMEKSRITPQPSIPYQTSRLYQGVDIRI